MPFTWVFTVCLYVCVYVCLGDSVEFLSWFLNALHLCLGGSKKSKETVISRTFRGKMRIYSRKVPPIDMVHSLTQFFPYMFTKLKAVQIFIPYERSFSLVF